MIQAKISQIYNLDCYKSMHEMEDNSIDLVLTDPPFDDDIDFEVLVKEFYRIIKPSGSIIMFLFPDHIWKIKTPARQICVWEEVYSPQGRITKKYRRFFDLILWWTKSEQYTFNNLTRYQCRGIFNDSFVEASEKMFCWQKPLSLIEKLVKIHSNPGDIVFDPFMGTGTTCLMAKRLGRYYIGCELDVERFQIATKRILI